jgi:hypothetical protein
MDRIRERRLFNDYERLRGLADAGRLFSFQAFGNPPEWYRVLL